MRHVSAIREVEVTYSLLWRLFVTCWQLNSATDIIFDIYMQYEDCFFSNLAYPNYNYFNIERC